MTLPKKVEVKFHYGEHGRIDRTLYLNKVQLEVIRNFFAIPGRPDRINVVLQLIDEEKARIEVFSSFKNEVKTAGEVLTNVLNSRKEIEKARQSLKSQGKPLR
jgi:hypothetical protein